MKKAKLLASIVSLCFALAVLCFGVFAAGQVDYLISGNISYNVSDAYVNIVTDVYQSTAYPKTKQDLALVAQELAGSAGGTIAGATTAKMGETQTLNTLNASYTNPYTPVASPTFDFNTKFTVNATQYTQRSVYIVVKVTNLAVNDVYAEPSIVLKDAEQNIIDPAEHNLVEYMSNGYSKLVKDQEYTIILAYALSEETSNVGSFTFTFGIDINASTYTPKQTLQWDPTLGFFYVKMGKVGGNDLRWRLYSIDGGATKYVTSAGTRPAEPVGKGVFVLEDAITSGGAVASCLTGNCGTDNKYVKFNEGYKKYGTEWYKADGNDYVGTNGSVNFVSVTDDEDSTHAKVLANDYFGSDIYTYLRAGYLTAIGVTAQSDIYKDITPRTQADLCQDMVTDGVTDPDESGLGGDYWITSIYNATSNITRSASKLWLLSTREALTIVCGVTGDVWNEPDEDPWEPAVWLAGGRSDDEIYENYWLRSPSSYQSSGEFVVRIYGDCYGSAVNYTDIAVRAAFELAL